MSEQKKPPLKICAECLHCRVLDKKGFEPQLFCGHPETRDPISGCASACWLARGLRGACRDLGNLFEARPASAPIEALPVVEAIHKAAQEEDGSISQAIETLEAQRAGLPPKTYPCPAGGWDDAQRSLRQITPCETRLTVQRCLGGSAIDFHMMDGKGQSITLMLDEGGRQWLLEQLREPLNPPPGQAAG